MEKQDINTLKDAVEYLKERYDEVKIIKKVKKNILVYVGFEVKKGKKKTYYLSIFDKKNNIMRNGEGLVAITEVKKGEINARINQARMQFNNYINEQRAERKNKNEKPSVDLNKKLFKKKKHNNGERFKSEKHLNDFTFLWIILRYALEYLDGNKDKFKIEQDPETQILQVSIIDKDKINNVDKLIYNIYIRLSRAFIQHKVIGDTTKGLLVETKFEQVYKSSLRRLLKKYKSGKFFFLDTMLILYLVLLWKEQVTNKTLDTLMLFGKDNIKLVYEKIDEMVEIAEEGNDEFVTVESTDNAVLFGDVLFEEVYGQQGKLANV